MITSTPSFSDFDPREIAYQYDVIDLIFNTYDYSLGTLEVLLSGSVGSGKSILMAHCGLRHCFQNPGARLLLGRKSMPDLRDTIYTKCLEHIEGTVWNNGDEIKEGVDFGFRDSNCSIWFANGSEMISRSWADKKFKKVQSLELSAAVIEQVEENDGDYWQAIDFIRMRVNRLPHVKQPFIIYGANPDDPDHPCAEYFELDKYVQK